MSATKMIVKDMAQRLALATGREEALHARQVRHWVQCGLFAFAPPARSGTAVTSPNYYSDQHFAAALIYALLSGQGWTVEKMSGLSEVVGVASQQILGESAAGFEVSCDELGKVIDFSALHGVLSVAFLVPLRPGAVSTAVCFTDKMRSALGHFR